MDQHGLTEADYANVEAWATYPGYSDLERAAIQYAEQFCIDHLNIDQALIDRLRHGGLSDGQILDATYSIASWLGLGRVMQVMQVESSCPLEV